ncbi:hypothetical protein BSKO_07617 [Bryopsis sp. KO-2023]|nr:hypothetical protein BSKO_07617 [Bryopsis sp. KO-2023]
MALALGAIPCIGFGTRAANRRRPERLHNVALTRSPGESSSSRCSTGCKKSRVWQIQSSVSEPQKVEGIVELTPAQLEARATVKQQLEERLEGIKMGIFGVKEQPRIEILALLRDLEDLNSVPAPLEHMEFVSGRWKLLFTTVRILGSKRSKLGLRSFVSLGNFTQTIDPDQRLAINKIEFSVAGFDSLMGDLTVEASYTPTSPSRVDIQYNRSLMVPKKLQELFDANYALLLSIFNPEGWLEITYVDETHRIGRNDKGQIFYLVREDPVD